MAPELFAATDRRHDSSLARWRARRPFDREVMSAFEMLCEVDRRPAATEVNEAKPGNFCRTRDKLFDVFSHDSSPTITLTLTRFTFRCSGEKRS